MAKVVVRLPEPKEEYDFSNQKQINRAIALIVEQLITEPIIMMENEVLQVTAATANRLHVTLSMLEINRD